MGPGGGRVVQVAVKPDDPRTALAATASTLFRTADGGASWQDTGVGRFVRTVVFSTNARRAFASDLDGLLYLSDDAGRTWRLRRSLGMPAPGYGIVQLVADPDQAETLYATTSRGIYASRDAGETWTPFWIPTPSLGGSSGVCALAFDPGNRSTIFSGPCGYHNYGGVYRSVDGGATWKSLRTDFGSVTALAFDPSRRGTLHAALDFGGSPAVVTSHDFGESWTRATYTAIPFSALTLSVSAGGTIYAGLAFRGISISKDDGKTWSDGGSGIPPDSSVWLAMHPATGAPLFAGVEGEFGGGGVYRASGSLWRRSSKGLFADSISGLALTRGGRLYAATDSGVFATDDGGASWTAPLLDGRLTALAVDAQETLYVSDYLTVRRSADGGATWTKSTLPVGGEHLAADPGTPGRLYAWSYGLARSDDGGSTWRTLIVNGGISAFAVDPGEPTRSYLWTQGITRAPDGSWLTVDPGLRRSADAGSTWVAAGKGIPAQTASCAGLAADPAHPGRVYAALLLHETDERTSGAIYRSDDAGSSWRIALRREGEPVQAIALDAGGVLFAGFPGAMLRSDDGGASWREVADGNPALTSLLADPANGVLYGGTSGRSLLRVAPRP